MTVSEYLQQSVAAHARYRMAHLAGDPAGMRTALTEAHAARLAAIAADPDHADRAWAQNERKFPHAMLMAFYEDQLAKP